MKTRIGLIGLGYVGLPLAVLFAKKKYNVKGLDLNKEIIKQISKGKSHFKDKKLIKNLKNVIANRNLLVSSDFENVKDCNIFIICVSTPLNKKKEPDLSYINSAIKIISPFMKKDSIIILESTVYPGICDEKVIPQLEKLSGLKVNRDFGFAYCPERINPGDIFWTSENIPRVLGASSKKTLSKVAKLYSSILGGPIIKIQEIKSKLKPKFKLEKKRNFKINSIPLGSVTMMRSIKDAESVKVMENTIRDVNIALVNELAKMSDLLNLDVIDIIDGMTTKPFGKGPFYPGTGVGGHCIAVDPEWLHSAAKKKGYVSKFIELSRTTNNNMPEYTVSLLKKALKSKGLSINGLTVGLLGVSYKKNVDDPRESPFFKIYNLLLREKISLKIYDSWYQKNNKATNLKDAVNKSDVLIIITDHTDMINNLKKLNLYDLGVKIILDGRNCLDPNNFNNSGILYKGIGR